jgi:hypothetical protein
VNVRQKNQRPRTKNLRPRSYLRLPAEPLSPRSTESCPPPAMSSARQTARSTIGYSIPAGAKNPGQCTAKTATIMVQASKNAATRVSKPNSSRTPPINSENAAAPHQSQAGRMNGKGAGLETNALSPLPSKLPSTFCEPCARKTAASARRSGSGTHVEEVAISLLNISGPFQQGFQDLHDISLSSAKCRAMPQKAESRRQ